MKTKTYYLALAIVVGTLCVSTVGAAELPLSEDDPFLIARLYPALAGIEQLYVVIIRPHFQTDEGGLVLKELEQSVRDKLKQADITVAEDDAGKIKPGLRKVLGRRLGEEEVQNLRFRSVDIPELRICVDLLKLKDSQQYVFYVQISLLRPVRLARKGEVTSSSGPESILKADVWERSSPMQTVSVQDMPARVTGVVLDQVEAFIHAYDSANPPGKRRADAKVSNVASHTRAQSEQPASQAVAEYGYVASKNSDVFHKAGCRWAKRIAQKNLVHYNSRQEAIKAGKRPCKMCKP